MPQDPQENQEAQALSDQPVDAPPSADAPSEKSFPIVGIGASAGGLAAFEAFFSAMPADTESGMALVLVQHLSPNHKSILSELVKRYTRMQVYEVEDGMEVKPNCAYIIPPNRDMAFLNGALQLLEPSAPRGIRLPIDFFFRSLAQDQRERAICIVLSGTGSDGTLGLRAVKGEGGMAMVQDPESTEYDGMPRSAIATGLVDYVLPPREMPAQLVAYVAHAFGKRSLPVHAPEPQAFDSLKKICVTLRAHTGHDFSQYKENTVVRRVERRMAIHQIEQPEEYLRYMQQNPVEVDALFRELLIGVTNFFRDSEAFEALQTLAIPRLFSGNTSQTIRAWVCGCSTGEEAYSIAILVQEHLETLRQAYKVQIFATDVDRRAIEQARAGIFPASIAADVSPERLVRFFTTDADAGVYRIQKIIRDLVVFSEQDVIKDPPFSKLNLVSCRNLMIYMNADLQKKLIPMFHYALNPEGVLLLGTSETIGEYTGLFSPLDRKEKLYLSRRDTTGAARLALGDFVPPFSGPRMQHRSGRGGGRAESKLSFREVAEQALLRHFVQAGVIVNGRGEIHHIYGRTGKYLEPSPGDAGVNILLMAREGLRRDLTTALHKVVAKKEMVRCPGLRVKTNGDFVTVDLTVRLATGQSGEALEDLYLIIIEELSPPGVEPESKDSSENAGPPAMESDARIVALEQEIRAKEEYLQTTLEEMESSGEELKSANEEMQSVNEELQSTNEELETSKEELQSINEELATVNGEMQAKVLELSRANNDMNNVLTSTGVAMLFVDHQLRIARFTPAITQLINLIQTDIGRPVGHIVLNMAGYTNLVEDVRGVLETLASKDAEVETKSGAVYLMRIRPYRTTENVIEGAVVTFVDITERRRMAEVLRENEEKYRLLFDTMAQGIVYQDQAGHVVDANPAAQRMLGIELHQMRSEQSAEFRWKAVREDGSEFSVEEQPALMALRTGKPVLGVILGVQLAQENGPSWVRVNAIPRFKPGEKTPFQVYSTFDDITDLVKRGDGKRSK